MEEYLYFLSFDLAGNAVGACHLLEHKAEAFLSANGIDKIHLEVDKATYDQVWKRLQDWKLINGEIVKPQGALF